MPARVPVETRCAMLVGVLAPDGDAVAIADVEVVVVASAVEVAAEARVEMT